MPKTYFLVNDYGSFYDERTSLLVVIYQVRVNSRKKNVVGVLEIFNKLSPALSTTIRIRNLPKGKIDTIKKPKDDD